MQTTLSKNAAILVVDDNALILQLVSSWLDNKGYRVSFATNGKQALSIAQTVAFDLILLDVQMPDLDGYEVCQRLKEIPETKNIPVIFLTAKSETEDLAHGYEVGGVDFITKPFNPVELLARVKTHIELKRALDFMKEQKEAELKESEERFTQIVEQTNEMIWEINSDGMFTYVSPGCELIYGYQPDELIGKKYFYDLHPEEGRESFKQALLTIFTFKKPFRELINAGMTKSGNLVWVSSNGLPVTDVSGNLIGYRGAEYNITDRKLAEEALRESELKYRSLIENAFDAIFLIKNGRYEYVNQHFCEITGYTKEALIAQPYSPKQLFAEYEDYLMEGIADLPGADFKDGLFEVLLVQKDGKLLEVEVSVVTLSINNRRSILGIVRDISGQKKMIRELKKAKDKAEEMNRVKSHFLALVSHELRTPLNGILGFAQILNSELLDQDLHHMTEVILRSSQRLKSTLSNLLDLTRIEASRLDVKYKPLDLSMVVQKEISFFFPMAVEKAIELTLEISAKDAVVVAEEGMLKSIINNLIDNAIKYTEYGSVTVKLYNRSLEQGTGIVLEVADSGMGIPDDMKTIIFEEFRQVSEGISRGFEGTGLGLTLTKKYVQLLNGDIEVCDNAPRGSIFRIILPLELEKSNAAPEHGESGSADTVHPKAKPVDAAKINPRILNVEDDLVSQSLISKLLRPLGSVETAKNAHEALRMVAQAQYDLILMDINLGKGMTGLDAVQEIRKMEQYKTIPIIAITAFAMESDRDEFIAKGCSNYLSKPFDNGALVNIVKSILSVDVENT